VLLRGLTRQDVARFVEVTAGIEPPQGMVEAVHQQTEGNPLFLTEVVRLLVQEGELTPERVRQRDSWSVRIPEGVREVIGRRLNRLSQRCNQTLATASIIGREFSLEQLKPLVEDLSEDRLLEVLEDALSARIIEELPQAIARYQFTHALIQETLAGELTMTRKVRLHAQIAEALETLYGAEAEGHAAELAYHFAEAEAVLGTEKLVRYSLQAGEKALTAYAWEEALSHFQRGLAAKESLPMDDQTAALLFGLGCSQAATVERARRDEIMANVTRAFDYYAEVGDAEHAVAVAEHPLLYVSAGWSSGAARIIHRALEMVSPDSLQAGNLLALLGSIVGEEEGDYDGALDAFDRALVIARRARDGALELRTLAYASAVHFHHNHHQKCLEDGSRAAELARHFDDPRAETRALFYTAAAFTIFSGDLATARQYSTHMLDQAERLRDRQLLERALFASAIFCSLEGDWRGARDYIDRGLTWLPASPHLLNIRIRVEYETGEFGAGEMQLESLVNSSRQAPSVTAEAAWLAWLIPWSDRIAGLTDRFDLAKAAAEPIIATSAAVPYYVLYARSGLALMAVQRGDVGLAAEQYRVLSPHRGILVAGATMSSDRLLGQLSHTMGNLDQAKTHFEEALTFCRNAGYRPELAWSCCDYADALLQRNNPGDREQAMSLLDESLAISTELGMRPLMERVLSRRDILKA
ncbi:MAG: hypothetical protein ACE5Q6_20505, partial [Dehalococcoidia bacterium]